MQFQTILQAGSKGAGMDFLPLILILGVFFLFIILPQMRKQKKAKAYLTMLKKGDYIITTGGLHGKIVSIGETHIVIEFEEGRAKVEKNAISMEMTMAAYKPKEEVPAP